MAGEQIEIKKGKTLTIKSVSSGTKQDGTEWMQIHVIDDSGKVDAGAFINPIPNLREGDHVVIDDIGFIAKRTPNRHAFNTKSAKNPKEWVRLDDPQRFISETTPQLVVHPVKTGVSAIGEFEPGDFDPEEGELPF